MNKPVPAGALTDLCRLLGHDPDKVARMVIEPRTIEVTYIHHVERTRDPDD
jgi:hypothetical protein